MSEPVKAWLAATVQALRVRLGLRPRGRPPQLEPKPPEVPQGG
jgi:hypothetical protein